MSDCHAQCVTLESPVTVPFKYTHITMVTNTCRLFCVKDSFYDLSNDHMSSFTDKDYASRTLATDKDIAGMILARDKAH